MSLWTKEELDNLKSYGVPMFKESCTLEDSMNRDMPYDVYLITYKVDNEIHMDLVRPKKRVYAFDVYYDKFGKGSLISIKQANGRLNPKLYGPKKEAKNKSV